MSLIQFKCASLAPIRVKLAVTMKTMAADWRALAIVAAFFSMSAAFAQSPNFASLDIVAEDAYANPVRDLQPGEIRLFDDKQPRPVVYCHPNQQRQGRPRVVVVVFDLSYARVKSDAWNEMVRSLRQAESSEYLYLYVVTARGMLPVHRLPDLDAESPPANASWVERLEGPIESALASEQSVNRAGTISVSSYFQLASQMSAFPGRKSLVCIGCLWTELKNWDRSSDPVNAARSLELHQLRTALVQARVAVYPIGGTPASGATGDINANRMLLPDQIGALADLTGGRTYTFGQVHEAIEEALRDEASSYRVVYLLKPENRDGKRHRITLQCSRRGVRLLAPVWYFAQPANDAAEKKHQPIPDMALTGAFAQTDVGVSVSNSKNVYGGMQAEIRVDAHGLLFLHRNDRYLGNLALEAICMTPDGRRRACTELRRVNLDLSESEYTVALNGGLRFPIETPDSGAASRILFVVCDENSGALGTATLSSDGTH